MKNEKPNLIDNSLCECKEQRQKEIDVIERCVIAVMISAIGLVLCICVAAFYKRQANAWEGKAIYQEKQIRELRMQQPENIN